MNIEQKIKEIKKQFQGWTNGVDNCNEDCKEFAKDDLKLALEVINHLQLEIEKRDDYIGAMRNDFNKVKEYEDDIADGGQYDGDLNIWLEARKQLTNKEG